MTQTRRPGTIDGFVPSNQGRHIGFASDATPHHRRGLRLGAESRVRVRRPGLHTADQPRGRRQQIGQLAGAAAQRPVVATQRPHMRQGFPGFTSYGASRSTSGDAFGDEYAGGQSSSIGDTDATGTDHQRGRRARRQHRQQGRAADGTQGKGNIVGRFIHSLVHANWKKIFKRTALVTGVFLLVSGGWLGWKLFNNSNKVFGGDSILGLLNATKLKGEDKGQVNLLLAGVSTDDPGHSGADLTDSIMLISIDTTGKRAYMLSIPRDLWVDIPGYGYSKINAANVYGDQEDYNKPGYPPGGIGLLAEVISETLEMPIHYYAKVNYSAFRDAVNAVGGITVNIQSSDKRGLYDPNISPVDGGPLKLPNGIQQLDGQTALNLARARGNPTANGRYGYGFEQSDFTRTAHQRMMLLALKEKITSGGVVANPIKIGQLFDVIGKNTKTDLQPSEVRRLYDLGKQIDSANIQSLGLNDANGVNLLASYRSPDGASALIPAAGVDDYSDIQLYLKKAMTSDPVVREAAEVVVLNGGEIAGLASKFSNILTAKGLNVTAVGDADPQAGANVIIDLSNNTKPATKAYLQQTFGGSVTTTNTTGYADADFVVILGTNQTEPQTTEQ